MKNLKFSFFTILICFFCSGCELFAKENLPYLIDAEMVIDDSSEYEIAGLNFDFYNRDKRNVKSFTMVFYLFDDEGNPVSLGKNNIVLTVETSVNGGERVQGCLSLDSFLYEFPEERYQVDYLYLSRIEYEDDSVWSDPFGLLAF